MTDYEWDVYVAGPFFNPEQKETMDKVIRMIKGRGLTVFDPREHGKIIIELPIEERPAAAVEIFANNIIGVERSYAIFACIDNRDIGTAFELGVAWAISAYQRYYPRITFSSKGYGTNVMLSHSVHAHYTDLMFLETGFHRICGAIVSRDKEFLRDYFNNRKLAPTES